MYRIIEKRFQTVKTAFAVGVAIVAPGEAFKLPVFTAECFYGTDTGKNVLDLPVHFREIGTVFKSGLLKGFVSPQRGPRERRQQKKNEKRQRHVDRQQNEKRSRKLDEKGKQILRTVVEQFRHAGQIIGKHRHEGTGTAAGVKGKRLTLVVGEQLAAHIALHFRAHAVAEKAVTDVAGRAN